MFTGIIEACGVVERVQPTARGLRLRIHAPFPIAPGASLAVNGVCLTAVAAAMYDVVPETLSKTNLGSLKTGSRVNLERAEIPTQIKRLDGHVVQGHVEGVGTVLVASRGRMVIRLDPSLAASILAKGSIAVDGVSLTVVDADRDRFSVALIPYTLEHTTLGDMKKGRKVNIETDILVRYARQRPAAGSRITLELLKKAGFA